MQVLSHRGYWQVPAERNTAVAFRRSFELGFGTETDLRDAGGELVVSHDPPLAGALVAGTLFQIHRDIDPDLPLALNLKADGLQPLLRQTLDRYGVGDYFLFDMSVPDLSNCIAAGLTVFTRQSEHEPVPAFYDLAAGVWVDGFTGEWYGENDLSGHLEAGKRVCIVSPELHSRDHRPLWDRLSRMALRNHPALMLCTDRPEEARKRFNE